MRIDELKNGTSINYTSDYYGLSYGEIKFFQTYNDEYALCGIWFRSLWSAPNMNGEKVRERKYGYDFLPESIFCSRLITDKKLAELNGGGRTLWYLLGGIATFLAGLISGFVNPKKCN